MNFRMSKHKKFSIKTFGCKVNQYESQLMREDFVRSGFEECGAGDAPDLFIINSCTVTDNADKDVRYSIRRARRMIPGVRIVVTGCYAENDEAEIAALPGVTKIVKNADKSRIASILNDTRSTINDTRIISDFKNHTKAFVKIQGGCENFCSYCKVPYVRGPFRSRPLREIVEETGLLVSKGFKEIILTGICLGAWGIEKKKNVCEVVTALQAVNGDFRIRLSSIEPKYVTDELIGLMASDENICRHLHIPLQSGDDRILARMNRPYGRDDFRTLVEKIRSDVEGAAITTDVIIGFPGEEEENFRNTFDLIGKIMPARTHIFTYSRRKGTAAFDMNGTCSKEVLKKRFLELEGAASSASFLFRRQFLGKALNILVETRRDRASGLLTGYSDNYIKVIFRGPDSLMNTIASVNIEDVALNTTTGRYDGN